MIWYIMKFFILKAPPAEEIFFQVSKYFSMFLLKTPPAFPDL